MDRLDEAQLICGQTCDETRVASYGRAIVAALTSPAPEPGRTNEDALALIPLGEEELVLAVADGVGGSRAGARASKMALEALVDRLSSSDLEPRDRSGEILEAFDRANDALLATGSGGATTLATVWIAGDRIRPFHVGDSEILLVGQRGRLKFRSVSHSPTAYAVEAGMISEGEAIRHEDRHLLSNCLGSRDMRVEVGPTLKASRFDTLLIASDGLFDNLHLAEVVERVRSGSPAEALDRVVGLARHRMNAEDPGSQPSKADDLTVLLARPRALAER